MSSREAKTYNGMTRSLFIYVWFQVRWSDSNKKM